MRLSALNCFCGVLSVFALNAVEGWAKDVVIKKGPWKITYAEEGKNFSLDYRQKKNNRTVFVGSMPEVVYDNASGVSRTVNSASFGDMTYVKENIDNEFGKGVCYSFTFSRPVNGDEVTMKQNFYVYNDHDYLITDLSITGDGNIRSNYLAPVSVTSGYELYEANVNNRMLKVPFDNDSFVRYHKFHMSGDMTSYEVGALYEGESRDGVIFGSVEHDRWKSAVKVKASRNGRVESLKVFSGVSDNETRDVLPHGKLVGPTVSSARMFIGCYDDWRQGMDAYGKANTQIQPKRDNWKYGTPFGWQSWGVMSDKNSFEVDTDISRYFHQVLKPAGFCNDQGINVISIDAWDNLSNEKKVELNKICAANGQIAGTYCTPFALWWNEDMLSRKLNENSNYTGWDCVLKINGKPYKLDGAYCLDPTHPGVKANISAELRRLKAQGFKYVKVDFTSNGMVQADAYYNPNVKTAVEAYNEGFKHFIEEADKGEPLFVALSIAPMFPYQYGNSRRIACDTWGKINQSEYSMNAISGGWWTQEFYQFNDPDHLVLVGNDAEKETVGENRARVTNGAVSGMLLVSDNYSLSDKSGRGDAVLSRERAQTVLMNKDVNEIGNMGRSFRPVFGYDEYNRKHDGAENCFMYHTPEYLYVAVINYKHDPLAGQIPLELLEITANDFDRVKELWSGQDVSVSHNRLIYELPGRDAKIYRFHKKK